MTRPLLLNPPTKQKDDPLPQHKGWAEAPVKIARMTLTIKLDGNWSSFQLANSAPPLSVTDSAIAPSARIQHCWRGSKPEKHEFKQGSCFNHPRRGKCVRQKSKRLRCYPEGCAAPGFVPCQCNTRGLLSKLKEAPPQRKIDVTSKSPVGDISVVTLIRTDTTLDHSQKAEKVCRSLKNAQSLKNQTSTKTLFLTLGRKATQQLHQARHVVGKSSQAACLMRNSAMDDSIGGS